MPDTDTGGPQTALVVADGDIALGSFARTLLADFTRTARPLVVAADGGALKAERLGFAPDVVVGDLDSLSAEVVERLRAAGVEVRVHPVEKDESDLELAMREAVRRGGRRLVIVGALGGRRPDHTLANVLLLTLAELAGCEVTLLDSESTVRLLAAPGGTQLDVHGQAGDLVSLLPLSERVDVVTTEGLAYPLREEPLWQGSTRGLSNVLTGPVGRITIRAGRLAVCHTRPDQLAPTDA